MKLIQKDFPIIPLPFGPQHPASAHFHATIELDGEVVRKLTPSPGYLHRGFEKLMEYRTPEQNAPLVDRLCIVDPFSKELGHAAVVEKVVGVEAPERGRYIRVIMAELGRILSHITWLGVFGMALGMDTVTKIAWGDRERIIRINEMVTGGRIYPCFFTPGGVRRDLPDGIRETIIAALDYLEGQMRFYDDLVFTNSSFTIRTKGVGKLGSDDAVALGATGPNLRATGVDFDLRRDQPYDVYDELDFDVVTAREGDAFSRAMCRRLEIDQSISIVKQCLDRIPEGEFRAKKSSYRKLPDRGEAHFCCEAARGELCFHMVSRGGKTPYRVKVRGPTFSHTLAVFPFLARGAQMSDIPAIYWSLDCVPADMDR